MTKRDKNQSTKAMQDVVDDRSLGGVIIEPVTFSGKGDDSEAIAADYVVWKGSMNNYISYLKETGGSINRMREIRIRISGLCGYALTTAMDKMEELSSPSWADIEKHLDKLFLGSVNSHAVIASLREVKQRPDQSVNQYAAEFNKVHSKLVKLGASNRDAAVQWFVDGLLPELRMKVNENLIEDQPLKNYDISDANGAVAHIINIALAKEFGSKVEIETEEWNECEDSEASSYVDVDVDSLVGDLAHALSVDKKVVARRLENRECLACGSLEHLMRSCPDLQQARVHYMNGDGYDEYDSF